MIRDHENTMEKITSFRAINIQFLIFALHAQLRKCDINSKKYRVLALSLLRFVQQFLLLAFESKGDIFNIHIKFEGEGRKCENTILIAIKRNHAGPNGTP